MAEAGLNLASASFFERIGLTESLRFRIPMAQPFGRVGVTRARLRPEELIKMNRMNTTKTIAATPTTGWHVKLALAAAALVLALLAIPHAGHAQGVIGGMEGGAQQGVHEGGRAAGPVGA